MFHANKPIRVLICNRYTLLREGMKALLPHGAEIEVVGEAATAKQALDSVARLHPDVVLLDSAIPDLSGAEATRRLKATDPHVQILILSMDEDVSTISGCLRAGAAGYVGKNDRPVQLRSAIRSVTRRRGSHAA